MHNFIHEREMFGKFLGPIIHQFRRLTGEKFEIYFGDGSDIPMSTKENVLKVIDSHTWTFEWQRRDVLIIDNLLYWHGRNSFKGKRKILAGLIGKAES
jgi:alpha-ketoglutarate-dependent taurine dioxygenase